MENVDVELGHLTVLVGRNGAGKSNIIDAIKFVQESLQNGLEAAVANRNGFFSLRRWTAEGETCDIEINISIKLGTCYGEYSFTLAESPESDFRVKREACFVWTVGESPVHSAFEIRDGIWIVTPNHFDVPDSSGLRSSTAQDAMRQMSPKSLFLPSTQILIESPLAATFYALSQSNSFLIYPNIMREPQRYSTSPRMGDRGENFSSALRILRQQWEKGFKDPFAGLLAALRRVVADVRDIRVKQVGGYLVTEMRYDYEGNGSRTESDEGAPWFDLSQESDGTLRMLGLLIGLYQPGPTQRLVAIEEPEVNIHPGALAVLSDVLREVSERRQVLLTTQSPDLISRFPVDDLRIVERRKGSTHVGRIADSQRRAVEQQLFTTGDLMRIEGLYSSEEANGEYA